jgi:sugar lactone lactonase YvrE
VPQAEINTLADILAACVNTTGTTSACSTLFNDAQSGGTTGTQPSDTATAAINIAHNPSTNIAALYGTASASPPFSGLATQPNDFTIAINYTGAGVSMPYALAIDSSGDVWVTDTYTDSASELYAGNVNGAYYAWSSNSPITGLGYPEGIAIDGSGNAWVSNYTSNSLSEFTSSGSAVSGSPFTGGGLNGPFSIAIHPSGYVLVVNRPGLGNSVSVFSLGGSAVSGSPVSGGGLDGGPFGIAVDISGHVWTTNPGAYTLSEFSPSGTALSPAAGWGNGNKMSAPKNFAIDASGNLWIADGNLVISALSEYTPSTTPPTMGTFSSASPMSGGGLDWPWGVAIDGAGNVWTSNYYSGYAAISEFNPNTGAFVTQTPGYITKSGAGTPIGIAIDGSGNVWVACQGDYGYNDGTLTEYVGAAAPVVTPMVANLMSPYGAAAVNKP